MMGSSSDINTAPIIAAPRIKPRIIAAATYQKMLPRMAASFFMV
jgi:hypothetical protein